MKFNIWILFWKSWKVFVLLTPAWRGLMYKSFNFFFCNFLLTVTFICLYPIVSTFHFITKFQSAFYKEQFTFSSFDLLKFLRQGYPDRHTDIAHFMSHAYNTFRTRTPLEMIKFYRIHILKYLYFELCLTPVSTPQISWADFTNQYKSLVLFYALSC